MEEYEIGSKIVINGNEFVIDDIWEGYKMISENNENTFVEVYFANLKDQKGNMIGPVEIGISR